MKKLRGNIQYLPPPTHINVNHRAKAICVLFMMVISVFVFVLLSGSGIVPGASPACEIRVEAFMDAINRTLTTEGSFIDRDGNALTTGAGPGRPAMLVYPEAFGFLLGYNSTRFARYGLRHRLDWYLNHLLDDYYIGSTVQLTLSTALQLKAYELIGDTAGSVIIMENASGKLLALASRATIPFNPNLLDDNMATYNAYEGFFLPNGWTERTPPGSTFKLITAAAALEHGFSEEELRFYDMGSINIPGGSVINNFNNNRFGQITMERALMFSVNTYFANLALELGTTRLDTTMHQFMLNSTIELDFATITSAFDWGNGSLFYLAQTGFGQGRTQMTPLHLAMVTQSIANDGTMMTPYVIQEITTGNGTVVRSGSPTVLTETISPYTAQALQAMMVQAAHSYGLTYAQFGTVGAKTGTAELGTGYNQVYLVVFTDNHTIVMSRNYTTGTSSQLIQPMMALLTFMSR